MGRGIPGVSPAGAALQALEGPPGHATGGTSGSASVGIRELLSALLDFLESHLYLLYIADLSLNVRRRLFYDENSRKINSRRAHSLLAKWQVCSWDKTATKLKKTQHTNLQMEWNDCFALQICSHCTSQAVNTDKTLVFAEEECSWKLCFRV